MSKKNKLIYENININNLFENKQKEKKNKNAAGLIKIDPSSLNDEIVKLEELQNKLEKLPDYEINNNKEELVLKNEELKAYEDYFNKYLDVDLKLEEEIHNGQEKKLKENEIENQKLEEKIKAYDTDQELKKNCEPTTEEEAIKKAEIEIDRKRLEYSKKHVEIQKLRLKFKKTDKLKREAQLKDHLEETRKKDRETIKRQFEM